MVPSGEALWRRGRLQKRFSPEEEHCRNACLPKRTSIKNGFENICLSSSHKLHLPRLLLVKLPESIPLGSYTAPVIQSGPHMFVITMSIEMCADVFVVHVGHVLSSSLSLSLSLYVYLPPCPQHEVECPQWPLSPDGRMEVVLLGASDPKPRVY